MPCRIVVVFVGCCSLSGAYAYDIVWICMHVLSAHALVLSLLSVTLSHPITEYMF